MELVFGVPRIARIYAEWALGRGNCPRLTAAREAYRWAGTLGHAKSGSFFPVCTLQLRVPVPP